MSPSFKDIKKLTVEGFQREIKPVKMDHWEFNIESNGFDISRIKTVGEHSDHMKTALFWI